MLRSDGQAPADFLGRPVLNSGVLLGHVSSLLAYLDWLLASTGAWCDQGRLNSYAKAFPHNVSAPPLTASRILTFDRFDLDRFNLDASGRVLNCQGVPYSVLHRLDACLGSKCASVPAVVQRRQLPATTARPAMARATGALRHQRAVAASWSVKHAGFVNDVGCRS